jgi:hypothetical protein
MITITLTGIGLKKAPTVNQSVTVKYKPKGAPDSAYVLKTATAVLQPNGSFLNPIALDNLLHETEYTVLCTNNCNGTSVMRDFVTPAPLCVDITALSATAESTTPPPPPPPPVIAWLGFGGSCEVEAACYPGYTLSPDGTSCTRIDTISPSSSESPIKSAATGNSNYAAFGMRLYDPGFDANTGSGAATEKSTGFWINAALNNSDGIMNRNAVWVDANNDGVVDALAAGKQLTVSIPLVFASAKTIYVGVAGDNKFTLTVNGAMIARRINPSDVLNFRWWHVYPVQVQAGQNIISVTGEGDGSVSDAIAMQVYENTAAQILAAATEAALNIRFKTASIRGGVLQIVTCAPGYQPVASGGVFVCQKVQTQAPFMQPTGKKIWDTRIRTVSGVPDAASVEANTQSGGLGTYIAPANTADCLEGATATRQIVFHFIHNYTAKLKITKTVGGITTVTLVQAVHPADYPNNLNPVAFTITKDMVLSFEMENGDPITGGGMFFDDVAYNNIALTGNGEVPAAMNFATTDILVDANTFDLVTFAQIFDQIDRISFIYEKQD